MKKYKYTGSEEQLVDMGFVEDEDLVDLTSEQIDIIKSYLKEQE